MKKQIFIFLGLVLISFSLWTFAMKATASTVTLGRANVLDNFFKTLFMRKEVPVVKFEEVDTYQSKIAYEEAIIQAVEKVSPSVISITISKNVPIIEQCIVNPGIPNGFFGNGFQFTTPCQTGTEFKDIGGGSGFIVSPDGMIITNKHVVSDNQASYTVFTNEGKKYDAEVIAIDPIQDIALIKIQAENLPVAPLGDSDSIRTAQTVIAIGNSLGEFQNTVSVGIISGQSRNIVASDSNTGTNQQIEGAIQTDAAINPGNSGGPLVNLKGEVIGINSAVISGAENIGFSIPINNAKRDIRSVQAEGKIIIPFLGVRYRTITPELVEEEELPVDYGAILRSNQEGSAIVPNSPAEKAGLQEEDIVLKVNNTKIGLERSLVSIIQRYTRGEEVTLTILRNGQEMEVKVVLEERN